MNFLGGWIQDRVEDVAMEALGPAITQRIRRMRAWRQGLSEGVASIWKRYGVAGHDLRGYEGMAYSRALEEELVKSLGGPTVHQHEMMWIRAADGSWTMVEALLDSGNSTGLVIPSCLAHELGYCSEAGVPYRQYRLGSQEVNTVAGPLTAYTMRCVQFSIGGCELQEDTSLKRTPSRAQLAASVLRQAKHQGVPNCHVDTERHVRALEKNYRHVLVPAQTIRILGQRGIRFTML